MDPRVYVTRLIPKRGLDLLRGCAETKVWEGELPPPREVLLEEARGADGLLTLLTDKIDPELMDAAPNLKVISNYAIGYDNVDVEAATRCGILVVNAPTGNTVSAAEHAIALMMALARNIPQANAVLKTGLWKRNEFMGTELRGKTLGIIGLGNVGSEVAKRAKAFEMRVLGTDPLVSEEQAKKLRVELVNLEQLLRESDFISLHLPLTTQTRGFIGSEPLISLPTSA